MARELLILGTQKQRRTPAIGTFRDKMARRDPTFPSWSRTVLIGLKTADKSPIPPAPIPSDRRIHRQQDRTMQEIQVAPESQSGLRGSPGSPGRPKTTASRLNPGALPVR